MSDSRRGETLSRRKALSTYDNITLHEKDIEMLSRGDESVM
jgi:hypothetical protein